eukprot:700420-Hanusia_phi.AAC.2
MMYEGYCYWCYVHEHPDNPIARQYKTKERHVFDKLVQEFPDITWINDKPVYGGCSRRRPDVFADLGTHTIMVEVDENQHSAIGYTDTCERVRLSELVFDVGLRQIIIIRINVDGYIDSSGKRVPSPWGKGKILTKHKESWEQRLKELYAQVHIALQPPKNNELVSVIKLFYDFVN